jgi:hypothetical protein
VSGALTITVYGGAAGADPATGEIGGNKILVETGDRTFFLDFGTRFGLTGYFWQYDVYAGTDESGDQQLGIPGRLWGAFGGSPVPTPVTVAGAATYPASFSIGFPTELEPNNTTGTANVLMVGGSMMGTSAILRRISMGTARESHNRGPTRLRRLAGSGPAGSRSRRTR